MEEQPEERMLRAGGGRDGGAGKGVTSPFP